jgi:type II secretory pathway pseudopilin PulG
MRSNFDFSSWQGVLSTLVGLVIVSFVAIGIRLLLMHSVQLRRERQNRQINERLKTLIAAYKTLGGSFTGELAVDPRHLRELRKQGPAEPGTTAGAASPPFEPAGSDRRRRTRDAVEAALSDVILLGTQEQVRLAARAANEMVAGHPIETAELVMSLRAFIREVLDLEAIPVEFAVPRQGPTRASGASARGGRAEKQGNAGAGGKGGEGMGGGTGSDPSAPPHAGHGDPEGLSEHSPNR